MADGKAVVDELLNADVYDDEFQNELYHHGILGQKWGVRRYQNADGSLTKAGEKRYGTAENFNRVQAAKNAVKLRKATARADSEIAKYRDKSAEKEEKQKAKDAEREKQQSAKDKADGEKKASKDNRPISEMTNEEIQAKIDRLKLENQLKQIMPAKEKTTQEKFMEAVGDIAKRGINDLISQGNKALVDTGKKWLEQKLGLDEKKLSALEKEAKDADLKNKIFKMQQEEAKARQEKTKADRGEWNLAGDKKRRAEAEAKTKAAKAEQAEKAAKAEKEASAAKAAKEKEKK